MSYTLLEQVKIRLKQFHMAADSDTVIFDRKEQNPLIEQLIEQAKQEIISRRMYPESYTDKRIQDDLKRFDGIIVNLSVYDYSQAGEAYMESYAENGVSRNWKDRDSLFAGVYPIAKLS